MKKVLISVLCALGLGACANHYDYFRGDIQYVQDGTDCIYYMTEHANHYNQEIRGLDTHKRIVYRNTMCHDLYERDHVNAAPRSDRSALLRIVAEKDAEPVSEPEPAAVPTAPTPVVIPQYQPVTLVRSGEPCPWVLKRRYIITPNI